MLVSAHLVLLSVFTGVTPLESAVSCSSVTKAAKRVELDGLGVWLIVTGCVDPVM